MKVCKPFLTTPKLYVIQKTFQSLFFSLAMSLTTDIGKIWINVH